MPPFCDNILDHIMQRLAMITRKGDGYQSKAAAIQWFAERGAQVYQRDNEPYIICDDELKWRHQLTRGARLHVRRDCNYYIA